jgi:hypothetical protein
MVLQRFLDTRGFGVDERLAEGRLLALGEIEELARYCRQPVASLEDANGPEVLAKAPQRRTVSL